MHFLFLFWVCFWGLLSCCWLSGGSCCFEVGGSLRFSLMTAMAHYILVQGGVLYFFHGPKFLGKLLVEGVIALLLIVEWCVL